MRIVAVLALLGLAACGADGEPIRPSMNATVGIGSDGVRTGGSVTLSKGNISLGVAL